jgi:hypothetical protein
VAVGLLFEGTAPFRVICFIFGEGVGKDWGERLGTGGEAGFNGVVGMLSGLAG